VINMDIERKTMLNEREAESCYLGQFIPLHYHHNMLMDNNRMQGFKAAIDHVVFPGAKVLELGGGTGVLSWFAAAKAEKVWCVEFNPDMVNEANRLLAQNVNGHKVEVIHADAFEYLPPEPVDIVICEMIHVAMLREKLLEVIENFKQRYLEKFGGPLPIFMPEAIIMAVQPVQQDYNFEGYHAPIVQFQETTVMYAGTRQLGEPAVYSIIDFTNPIDLIIEWTGGFIVDNGGTLNALRFITKNILSVLQEQSSTIDWLNHYMVLPLPEAIEVMTGDIVDVSFRYRAGGSIASLQNVLQATIRQAEISSTEEAVVA
jgi:protein arginine N-methyltransferase 1